MLNIPADYHLQISDAGNSIHTRRTMMFHELSVLLDATAREASHEDYLRLIIDHNILRKQSGANRKYTARYLTKLYRLDPSDLVFSSLRYYWDKSVEDKKLLALLCSYLNDHLLRVSWGYIKDLPEGSIPKKTELEELLEQTFPERYSSSVIKSTTRSLLSTWTQSGHLEGKLNKKRSRPNVGDAAVSYALLLGYLSGERGQLLFSSAFTELLDCSLAHRYAMAQEASRRGMLIMKKIQDIVEIEFPNALTGEKG